MQVAYCSPGKSCYITFPIKGQTKAAAAFKGNFGVYGPILFKFCMQVAYCSPETTCYLSFAIKGQTKARAAFKVTLVFMDQFCSNFACRQLMAHLERLVTWPLQSKAKQRPQRPLTVILVKFKMEFLPTISLTKAFPVAQIRPNLQKIVSSSLAAGELECSYWGVRETALSRMMGGCQFTKLGYKKSFGLVLGRFLVHLDPEKWTGSTASIKSRTYVLDMSQPLIWSVIQSGMLA